MLLDRHITLTDIAFNVSSRRLRIPVSSTTPSHKGRFNFLTHEQT